MTFLIFHVFAFSEFAKEEEEENEADLLNRDDSEDEATEEMKDLGSSSGGEEVVMQKKKPRASRVKAEPVENEGDDEAVFEGGEVAGGIFDEGLQGGSGAQDDEEEEDWA